MPVSPSTRLFLVRHGEVDSNREMRYLGRTDEPLNGVGRRQAAALAGAFGSIAIDALWSSPLCRTVATAEAIADATGAAIRIDRRLTELDFGSWEGLTRHQARNISPEHRERVRSWEADPAIRTPDGESLAELQSRVLAATGDIVTECPGASVVIVTHMGPVKVLLCAALGLPLERTRRIFLDPATISVVDWGTEPVVRLINGHGHMGFDQARWMERPSSAD
ncbi:MAG: histidine phosphatase family protein [Holophagae bacterium]|jgi:broad specificity phosphatase PhoE